MEAARALSARPFPSSLSAIPSQHAKVGLVNCWRSVISAINSRAATAIITLLHPETSSPPPAPEGSSGRSRERANAIGQTTWRRIERHRSERHRPYNAIGQTIWRTLSARPLDVALNAIARTPSARPFSERHRPDHLASRRGPACGCAGITRAHGPVMGRRARCGIVQESL